MHSIAARTALRRVAAFAPVSRSVVVAKRYSSTEHDNDPEVLEKEKQRNLRKEQHRTSTTIHNAPGWNQYLASASEAAVKADRAEITPEELASETLKHIKARHHDVLDTPDSHPESIPQTPRSSINGEERIDAYEASYERDETVGPLKHSAPTEKIERETYKERVDRKETDLPGGLQ